MAYLHTSHVTGFPLTLGFETFTLTIILKSYQDKMYFKLDFPLSNKKKFVLIQITLFPNRLHEKNNKIIIKIIIIINCLFNVDYRESYKIVLLKINKINNN